MNDNKLYISGLCPYCPATLCYEEGAEAVVCPCCSNTVPTRLMRPAVTAIADKSETNEEKRIAESVTSASAGIIYLDNFVEEYDWREFALTSDLSVGTLDAIAECARLKFSADPITYLLDFRCAAIPALRKVEGLGVLELEIIDSFKSDDISDSFEYIDLYCGITKEIVAKRDGIIVRLNKDIELAKKFNADGRIIDDLERSIAMFSEKILAVNEAHSIEDVPGYAKAKELHDGELYSKFYEMGINAEKTYEKALSNLEAGNIDAALHLFGTINGYKDTAKLIARYSSIFKFNDELVEMSGSKCYLIKEERSYFNPQDPDGAAAPKTKKLYDIVNNAPGRVILSGISNIIHSYGSRIFFARNGVSLCVLETKSSELYANVRILDEAPSGDYVMESPSDIYFSCDKSKFFLRKKLRSAPEKRGCFGRKKNQAPQINRQNNYSIVLIDMNKVSSTVILPEVVDIMDFFGDKIFYTKVGANSATVFRVYDINTGEDTEILNANCIIHAVVGGTIIYSRWAPTEYNLDLYAINVQDKTPIVIDKNVSGFYTTYMGKVFYTVGADGCERLYSANMDGTDVTEVIENPGRICKDTINSGWLFYVNGEGRNACLMKVSSDGSKNSLVASNFRELVKMQNGYVFYVSTSGDLRVVRSDGNGDRLIARDVSSEQIIIDSARVYYLKRDRVAPATEESDGFGYSLFATDLSGKGFRKLAHDVVAITDYDEDSIYICKKRNVTFVVSTPVDKTNYRTDTVVRTVTTYEAYGKATGEFREIVRIGVPTRETLTYKSGCFLRRKTTTKESVITELRGEDFTRTGVAKSGLVLEEEREAARLAQERADEEKQAKKKKNKKNSDEA